MKGDLSRLARDEILKPAALLHYRGMEFAARRLKSGQGAELNRGR